MPTVKHSPKVNAWDCFSYRGVGQLHLFHGPLTADRYTTILKRGLLKTAKKQFGPKCRRWYFESDNDSKHTSKVVQAYFIDSDVNKLLHTSMSPDLNPIEHMWSLVDAKIERRGRSMKAFKQAICRAWLSVSPQYCRDLIDSMPARVEACLKVNGGATRY